ncbi:hypothetical protein AAFF_G00119520 [Aldrovandia affinis]|uniref:G-protein coupled receptors family 1 profile domain-containing protein n=1 Tax=Aldrovandia affinis TaxID=143900 RepID=A0AAD7WB32_9TELE|nr:hypothetical protein AAFF_G00119520 [Aldrovandia affinis]
MLTSHSQLVLSVSIITFLIGLPANSLAFYTLSRKLRQKPVPIDILLLNLTISDLIFLIFLPFKMKEAADNMLWSLPYILCPVTGFIFYSTIYNSTLFLMAVSVERYLGVAFPIWYKVHCRTRYAVVVSVSFWVLSSLNLSIVYIMPFYKPQNTSGSSSPNDCYTVFTPEQLQVLLPVRLELCLLLFCVPFLITCFCYINFIRILSRRPHIGRRAPEGHRHGPGDAGGLHPLLLPLQRVAPGGLHHEDQSGMAPHRPAFQHLQRLPGPPHLLLLLRRRQEHVHQLRDWTAGEAPPLTLPQALPLPPAGSFRH